MSLRANEEMRNVIRINIPPCGKRGATRGWQVRVMRGGRMFSKFFRGLGSGSLELAQRHRDGLLLKLGPARYNDWRKGG